MTPKEAKAAVTQAYAAGLVKPAWIASHIPGAVSYSTVNRWLNGKYEPPPERWIEMYRLIKQAQKDGGQADQSVFEFALKFLEVGDTPETRKMAAKLVAERRTPYDDVH